MEQAVYGTGSRTLRGWVSLAIVLALAGRVQAETSLSAPEGSRWRLVRLDGGPVVRMGAPWLQFESEGVEGFTGCNDFSLLPAGDLDGGAGRVGLGNIMQTLAGCPGAAGELEQAFVAALRKGRAFERDGSALRVVDGGGAPLLVFEPWPRHPVRIADVVGVDWCLRDAEGTRAPVDPAFKVEFVSDREYRASAGCAAQRGTIAVGGDQVRGTSSWNDSSCPPESQSRPGLSAMEYIEDVLQLELRGRTLRWTTRLGETLVFAECEDRSRTVPKR